MDEEQFHSQEISTILNKIPRWITRWGKIIVFLILILLVVISHLIKYSQTITAPITLQIKFTDNTTILDDTTTTIIGEMNIPTDDFVKVQVRQTVNIKLYNLSRTKSILIEGTIKSISLASLLKQEEVTCTIEIEIPTGIISDYFKNLKSSQTVKGTVEITTNKTSVFSRIIESLKQY